MVSVLRSTYISCLVNLGVGVGSQSKPPSSRIYIWARPQVPLVGPRAVLDGYGKEKNCWPYTALGLWVKWVFSWWKLQQLAAVNKQSRGKMVAVLPSCPRDIYSIQAGIPQCSDTYSKVSVCRLTSDVSPGLAYQTLNLITCLKPLIGPWRHSQLCGR